MYKMKRDISYIDLFHGIGGFALGAYWAGMKFDNHFCSDIEKYCQKLYKMRFPESKQLGDITKIDTKELLKYGNDWIITGGFPCQDISIAGKGVGINGKRSGLWFEYWRIIRDLRPRVAIMENVPALTFRGLDRVLGSLSEIGYNGEWQTISAAEMGAWHQRKRIWIVAYSNSNSESRQSVYARKRQRELVSNIGNARSTVGEISDPVRTGLQKSRKKQNGEDRKQSRGMSSASDWWSTESAVGRVAHGVPRRVDRLKGLGNSIVPQIAELLFNTIKELI